MEPPFPTGRLISDAPYLAMSAALMFPAVPVVLTSRNRDGLQNLYHPQPDPRLYLDHQSLAFLQK